MLWWFNRCYDDINKQSVLRYDMNMLPSDLHDGLHWIHWTYLIRVIWDEIVSSISTFSTVPTGCHGICFFSLWPSGWRVVDGLQRMPRHGAGLKHRERESVVTSNFWRCACEMMIWIWTGMQGATPIKKNEGDLYLMLSRHGKPHAVLWSTLLLKSGAPLWSHGLAKCAGCD